MTHIFQYRFVPGYEPPLKPGRYTAISNWYEVDRPPRVGERCAEYIEHVRQSGRLVRTTSEPFVVAR